MTGSPRWRLVGAAACVCGAISATGLGGCGRSAPVNRIHGNRLTIYASVPLEGASKDDSQAVISGARLALDSISSRIGKYRIGFRVLDDATVKAMGWDPGQTETNARLAVADPTTIGYIGELNSGASAVSIPLLNRVGVAQVSPGSTAVGLTSGGPGASPGEPEKYYPTGQRTFVRVVPDDDVEAKVQATIQRSLGCTSTYVVDDGEVDGLDTAMSFQAEAKPAGLTVVGLQAFQPGQASYQSFAQGVASADPNCVFISALTDSDAVHVAEQIAAALPHARIFGSAGLADASFTDPALGGVPLSLDHRILITVATLEPSDYPAAGRAFLTRYERLLGPPPPDAIFGYESMSLLLAAIERATDNGALTAKRSAVLGALFGTRDRASVLGAYSVEPDGDPTLERYGVWRVIGGQLSFWKAMRG